MLGYQIGAIVGWWIGDRGGRPFLERHGRWLHLTPERIERAERWFDRWDDWAVFVGRITPVARSFISIPAGVFEMPFRRYNVFTLLGNAIWCLVARRRSAGRSGASYETFHHDFRYVEIAVVAGIVALVAYWLVRRRKPRGYDAIRLMAIPHVDVKAQYAPLIPELKDAFARTLESGQFIFGPEVEAFEREAAEQLGVEDDGQLRQRHRRARPRARRDGHRPRRRGDLPVVHVLRDRRGDRPARRDAGVRRHRRDRRSTSTRREVERRITERDEGDHAGAPLRPPRARPQRRSACR